VESHTGGPAEEETDAQPTPTEPVTRTLISREEIDRRIAELARRIDEDYAGVDELVLVGILKGAFIFLADLSRALKIPRRIEFMALSSYRDGAVSGDVRLIMDLRTSIRDKHVMIVEDIVDSGYTLRYLIDALEAREPASLECCALVLKREALKVELDVRYIGFEIPDVWVVGYGLDYDEQLRTLGEIAAFDPPESEANDPTTE
jgi:hypoxanthine phosphoribosyltransferase